VADKTADRITVLEGLEAVRRRPALYIGGPPRRVRVACSRSLGSPAAPQTAQVHSLPSSRIKACPNSVPALTITWFSADVQAPRSFCPAGDLRNAR
jgi:hypothetical protein